MSWRSAVGGGPRCATEDLMPIESCLYGLCHISPLDPLRNGATVLSLRYLASETAGDGGGMIREWISASHFFNFIVSPWSCCKREFPVTVLPMCETELAGQPGIAFPLSVSVSRSLSLRAPPPPPLGPTLLFITADSQTHAQQHIGCPPE